MKKLMTIGTALALALTLSAAGCKKKSDDAGKTDTTKKPEENKGSAAVPTPDPAAGTTGSAAAPAAPAAPTDPAAGSAAPAAPADPAAAAAGGTGVAECDEYLATVEKAAKCDKFGPAADGVKKSAEAWKASVAGWGALDATAKQAAQSAAATTCKAASDGVKTTATSLGCTL